MLRFLLFDLDGTLVDSVPDLHLSLNYMLNDLGINQVSQDYVRQWVGNGAAKLIERTLQFSAGQPPESELHEKAMRLFFKYYQENLDVGTQVFPGARQLLNGLQDARIQCACITNKPRCFTEPLLSKLHLDQYFQVLVCGDDLPEKKPHPMPLLHALAALQVQAEDGFMVGDSSSDLSAAQQAGIRAILVTYGYNQGFTTEDPSILQANSLRELKAFIDSKL